MKTVQQLPICHAHHQRSLFANLWQAWRAYRETHGRLDLDHLSPHMLQDLGLPANGRDDLVTCAQLTFGR